MGGLSRFSPKPTIDVPRTQPLTSQMVTSGEEFLRDQGYGKAWPQVKKSLLAAPQPSNPDFQVRYIGKDMEKNLAKPIEVTTVNSRAGDRFQGRNEADIANHKITISHGEAEDMGFHPMQALHHEIPHLIQVPADINAALYPHTGPIIKRASNNMLEQGVHPVLIPEAAHQAGRATTLPEFLALAGHAKRMHYGMTGKPILTPDDHYNAFMDWQRNMPKVNDDPQGLLDIYGPDQIMQYGPNAGQPAHGFEWSKAMINHAVPIDSSEKRIRKIMELMGTTASNNQPSEVTHG